MGLVGLLITLIVEVVMLYWPGRLLIKIIVLVDFKGCQIFLITPSFICISMRNLFCLFLGVVLAIACTHKEFYSFTNEKNLEMISVKIDEILLADFMIKKGDYLFMISTRSDSMVYLYALPDLQYCKSFGIKGKGPGEFILPMFVEAPGNDVYIWGYSGVRLIRCFSVDSNAHITVKQDYHLDKYETFNFMHLIRDSICVYSLMPTQPLVKLYDLKNGKNMGELKIGSKNRVNSYLSDGDGVMAANDSVIIVAYHYKKQIDIYDVSTLKLKKRLIGDYRPQKLTDDFTENEYHYVDIVAGQKRFYALYRGCRNKDAKENSDILESFDYDGNPVIKYKFNDLSPDIFYVDDEAAVLYGYKSAYPDLMLKYELEERLPTYQVDIDEKQSFRSVCRN